MSAHGPSLLGKRDRDDNLLRDGERVDTLSVPPQYKLHYLPARETVITTSIPVRSSPSGYTYAPVFAICDTGTVFQTVLRYKYDTPLQLLVAPVVETLE